jgi:hypothetical protein
MPFQAHERYQTHCRYCQKVLEADTATEAILKAEEHERNECPKRKDGKK